MFWGRSLRRLLRNIALALFIVLVAGPIVAVILFRFVPPPVTPLMVIRAVEGKGLDHRWRPIDEVAPALPRALIAAEDARFCEHHGFDFNALQKAYANNEAGKKIRGGSTISQQTAKNVFLWPGRSYVRKGLEAWFTVLIEIGWGKKRIMEVYLNSIEFGPGIYGAEAASRRYFGVGADKLTQAQASRLAAILPSPLKWRVIKPGKYVAKRTQKIGKASGAVRRDGLADCVG
ncbi:monofunctional biosynthetic peptidoglycan transglycosylase [Caulobacter segnis]|uniref:Biosynthetic peptidoglycan transglycosylase n=1 Tax=Caulobacter segnis TaxID=88688 RepID=A0ABN5IXP5_9CAUL|nr:monofunctional biosynthetic peptidoglycan transglycosylase [Caulobacter segnis]AVQ03848.1 monofunctional biosynthetic peptidoglycan transglycosylase [Caulobacter segnis]